MPVFHETFRSSFLVTKRLAACTKQGAISWGSGGTRGMRRSLPSWYECNRNRLLGRYKILDPGSPRASTGPARTLARRFLSFVCTQESVLSTLLCVPSAENRWDDSMSEELLSSLSRSQTALTALACSTSVCRLYDATQTHRRKALSPR